MKNTCLIIRGPAGVGKTTLAKSLQKDFDFEYINCDQLRRKIFGDDKWQKEYKIQAMQHAAEQASDLLNQGKNVIIDDVFEYPQQIEIIKKQLPIAKWVTLEGTEELCIKRDIGRKEGEDERGYCGEEAIRYLYKHYLKEPIEGEIKVQTAEKTSREVSEEVKKKLI
ncbi:MAG: AAA family ATPase [Patescibacteria group bacterium]